MPPVDTAASAIATPPGSPADTARPLRRIADLAGPPTVPFFGNALQINRERVHQHMEALCKTYGPLFKVKFVGRTVLVVCDHVETARILKARPHGFRRSARSAEAARSIGLNLGLFMAEGDLWHRQRRMVMASFAPPRIRAYFPALLNVTQRLQDRWDKAAATGEAIDLQADLMRFTVDAVTGLAFGHDVNTLQAGGDVIQRHLDAIFPALFKRIFAIVQYWHYIELPSDKRVAHSVAEVNKAIDRFIDEGRERLRQDPARRENPPNLLEAFIVAAESDQGGPGDQGGQGGQGGLSDADVKGNVLTMLLAGEDTTANTLAWLIYLLKQNPDKLAKATEEVRRHAPGGVADFTPDTMAAMDYLDACANEAMRLKPVAPFLPVQAVQDTVVGDVAVPAGTLVWNVLRHDSVDTGTWPDALAFRPERWLEDGANQVKQTVMAFGSGPRVCPGRYLALLEIKLAMAMLLSRFDIARVDTPDGQEARELMAFTMGPDGLSMRLKAKAG